MNRKRIAIAAGVLMSILSVAAPVGAQGKAEVTTVCTQFGSVVLPPGPPPKQGLITVEVNGRVVTTRFVPGPCAAPGFVQLVSP